MELLELFRTTLPSSNKIIVYPDIEKSSIYNPYLSILYKEIPINVTSGNPWNPFAPITFSAKNSIVHYHWLEVSSIIELIKVLFKILPLLFFSIRGGTIIWTLHNLTPHKKKWITFNHRLQKFFSLFVAKIIVHSESARELANTKFRFPDGKVVVVPHPPYPVTRVSDQILSDFLKTNNIIAPYILMYGLISPYKQIESIIELFKNHDINCDLVVAGKIKPGDEEYGEKIRSLTKGVNSVHLFPRYIEDSEEAALFTGAKMALFNFDSILTSGSMILSYSYETTIISRPFSSALPKDATSITFTNEEELLTHLREIK